MYILYKYVSAFMSAPRTGEEGQEAGGGAGVDGGEGAQREGVLLGDAFIGVLFV